MILVMRSDNRDGLCYCTRSAYPIHRFVRVCPKAPIEGTQAVESFVGANGNGVVCLLWTSVVCLLWTSGVCLLWTSGVCIDEVICCRHVSYQRGRRYDLGITFPLVNQKKKNRYQQ